MSAQDKSRAKRKATGITTNEQAQAAHRSSDAASSAAAFAGQFIDMKGIIDANRLAASLRMTSRQLADTIGLEIGTENRAKDWTTSGAQTRLREMLMILASVCPWAGGEMQAMAWYRAEPIPALDGRTPEALVKAGFGDAVESHLVQMSVGGFA